MSIKFKIFHVFNKWPRVGDCFCGDAGYHLAESYYSCSSVVSIKN